MPFDALAASGGQLAFTSAKLAAQLTRERPAIALSLNEIAADAVAIAQAARDIREALETGAPIPKQLERRAAEAARRYNAQVVRTDDLAGMVFGLRLSSGVFQSGFRNLFFVA